MAAAVATKAGMDQGECPWTHRDFHEKLFLSPLTVKTHINRAMMKLGARDRAQLVVLAYEGGLVRAGRRH